MELTPEELHIAEQATGWVRDNAETLIARYASLEISPKRAKPLAVFMAGSPGAGKTEFSETLEEVLNDGRPSVARIDPDAIRVTLPGYEGGKAYILQKAVSRAVDEIFNSLLKHRQGFILDGTLSNFEKAVQNIERVRKRGYRINIFYVYQEPKSAWAFTQARERLEGRRIECETFVRQYFAAKEVVHSLKKTFGSEVRIMLIVKDTRQNIKDYKIDIDTIDAYIKESYTEKTLLETLT